MKAKRITVLLMALTLTAALSACGGSKTESASATEKATEDVVEVTGDAIEDVTGEAVDVTGDTIEVTGSAVDMDGQAETPAPDKADNPDSNTHKSGGSASNTANKHTHNWKEHKAERQVWVSNIVTVDDYEEQQISVFHVKCPCGAVFDTMDELDRHQDYTWSQIDHAALDYDIEKAREIWDCIDNFTSFIQYYDYETRLVKTGSHEEDHGHYETESYVDYRYCDCGARK